MVLMALTANNRQTRWRKANLHKYEAHKAVGRALKSGELVKPLACEGCGRTDCRIDGHHDDYRDQLKVRWLCRSCHYWADRPFAARRRPRRRRK